jgi:glycosyltransferase involved in cell wall biosynthesis
MNTDGNPSSVGVVIPAFNGARHLAATLESIRRQTRPADEVIVADDGSTDGTPDVVASVAPWARCLRLPHRGVSAALNAGISAAQSDILGFLDQDDLWVETKLALQLAVLARDPSIDAVFGRAEQFHSEELSAAERARHPFPPGAHPFIGRPTMLIRRAALERIGPFDPDQRHEFIDWYLRAARAGLRTAMVDAVVLRRRIHTTNRNLLEGDLRPEIPRLLGAWLRERRARGDRDA